MNTKELIWALDLLKPAILEQDLIPVLRHVCFREDEAIAFNDIISVSVPFLEFEEQCCVPGTILRDFLSTVIEGSKLKMEHSGSALHMKAGRSKVDLPVLDVKEFFFTMPSFTPGIEVILSDSLLDALSYVLPAVGDASMTSMELGVVLSVRKDSSEVKLFATDNWMISSASVDVGVEAAEGVDCILPKQFCETLKAMCNQPLCEGEVVLSLSNEHAVAHFTEADVVLYSKTVEPHRKGRLHDDIDDLEEMMAGILESSQVEPLTLSGAGDLIGSLRRAALFLKGDVDGIVTFSGEEGEDFVMVEAGTDRLGNIEDRVDLDAPCPADFLVSVKLQQMLDAVSKSGADSINPTTKGALTFTLENKEYSLLTLVAYKEDNKSDDEER